MPWPLSQDYNEAVQNPALRFSDAELKQTEARGNAIGIPMARSGNFADVYEMTGPGGKKWALKCFTREVPDLRERYAAISAYLKQANLPFMVDFSYLEQGVKVKGQWYPVLKMDWVEGFVLNQFVKEHADNPPVLELLCQIWVRLARRLREAKMAHCDLQHGNVLLVPGSTAKSLAVKLIDYDGMFVPALAKTKSGEVGHPAYQHPQRLRDGTYTAEVDRFPHLVIYTALRSLMVGSRYLWNKYDNGDNLLFRQSDLEAPSKSPLFGELMKLNDPEVRKLTQTLAQATQKPLSQTPLLDDLVRDTTAVAPRRQVGPGVRGTLFAEETPESIFADATAGEGTAPERPHRSGRRVGRSHGWAWATAAVLLLGAALAGVLFLGDKGKPKDTTTDMILAKNDPAKANNDLEAPPKDQGTVKKDTKAAEIESPKKEPARRLTLFPIPAVTIQAGEETVLEINYDSGQPAAVPSIQFQGYPAGLQFQRESIDSQKGVYRLVASAEADNSTRQVQVTLSLPDQKAQGQVQITVRKRDTVAQPSGDGGEIRQFVGHTGSVASVVFSPDGRRALSASEDKTMRLWDLDSGKELRRFEGHTATVSSVAFSLVGQHVLSGSQDKTVRLWDSESGKELQQFDKHSAVVWTVAFSPDGLYALSGSRDKTARLWETKTGKELQRFEGHTGCVHTAVFSPDGRHVLTGSCDHTVRLWDATTGKMLRRFDGHTHQVNSLAFKPDGRSALSGSWDTTLRLWDIGSGKELRRFPGHTDFVQSIAISPDGHLAISGGGGQVIDGKNVAGTDHTMRLWDIESGKELRRFNGHANSLRSVAFSPDGRRALSGSNDRTVRLWALPAAATGKPDSQPGLVQTITNSIGMKMVLIPVGTFRMGAPKDKDRHDVEITRPFWLGTYEVTQQEYEKVMGTNPSWFSAIGKGSDKVRGMDTQRFPVDSVNWHDAKAFCAKLSELPEEKKAGRVYRLPTEAEWEYACRGGAASSSAYHFGNTISKEDANFGNTLERTCTVGSYKPNAFGLYDMHGNVLQWCEDWYGPYGNKAQQDPKGPEKGAGRVRRGSAWSGPALYCMISYRGNGVPTYRGNNTGFRVVFLAGDSGDISASFKLRDVQVIGGPHRVGDVIRIRWDLVNISGKDLPIPVDKNSPSQRPSVGMIQRWIEKLDGDPTISAMSPKTARSARKYAAGGTQVITNLVVPKDQKLRTNPDVPTTGYLPGRYRYYVDYRKGNGELVQTEHVDFELLPP